MSTYLELVAEAKRSGRFAKGSDAHAHVMRTNRFAYAEHLRARGVFDPARDPARETASRDHRNPNDTSP